MTEINSSRFASHDCVFVAGQIAKGGGDVYAEMPAQMGQPPVRLRLQRAASVRALRNAPGGVIESRVERVTKSGRGGQRTQTDIVIRACTYHNLER